MSLDSLTNNAMDLLPILQFGFVIIDMDVSDGLWQHFQKNAMDPLHILEFPVVIIYMDVSDGL